jgi:XXXCH domain-containing protein
MQENGKNKKKAKHKFTRQETADYLRRLADQLENGTILVSDEEMEFEGEVKVKESLKSKKGKTEVKLEVKLTSQELPDEETEEVTGDQASLEVDAESAQDAEKQPAEPAEEEKAEKEPSYKSVKKLMDKQFKNIGKDLEEGGVPDPEQVKAFCDNCVTMTGFNGKKMGEDLYPDFLAKVEALRTAADGGDQVALAQAYAEIKAAKKACHKEYK